MILFAEQTNAGGLKDYITVFNAIVALIFFVVAVGSAVLLLLASRRNTVAGVNKERADANESLAKTRKEEIDECNKRCIKCTEELEDVTVELKAQTGINVKELFEYWQTRDTEIAEKRTLQAENRQLKIQLGLHER